MSDLVSVADDVRGLLEFLSVRNVVFLRPDQIPAAHKAHDKGWVALGGNAARITDAGRAVLARALSEGDA